MLRRYRRRDVPDEEVKVIRHVHAQGFPNTAEEHDAERRVRV